MITAQRLGDLLRGIDYTADRPIDEVTIRSVTADSRRVEPGSLFVCLRGLVADGHEFVATAVAQGAVAVVANRERKTTLPAGLDVPVLFVEDSRKIMGDLAAAWYDHPAAGLTLIGLTGTNGKTTTSYILEAVIRAAGGSPGVIGTINYRYGGHEVPANFTTPEPLALQGLLREMANHGVTHVIMEVSSHALALYRIQGVRFHAALFTNLTRDHLDFHQDMETYYQAKKRLFTDYLHAKGTAVILLEDGLGNGEGGWGRRLRQEITAFNRAERGQLIACGLASGPPTPSPQQAEGEKTDCQVLALDPVFGPTQTVATIQVEEHRFPLVTNLVGVFNLKNILGAVGVAVGLGVAPAVIARGLSSLITVPGRLEAVEVADGLDHPTVFVDYAHTPDALENVLTTLRELAPQRLLVVFGCGGDRDPGKRRLMGEIAGRLADVAIITSDNSRSESPALIMAEIERGVVAAGMRPLAAAARASQGYRTIAARDEAIALAIELAAARDIVLISGKGHETYQLTAQGSTFFDDRLEAARCLREKSAVTTESRVIHAAA